MNNNIQVPPKIHNVICSSNHENKAEEPSIFSFSVASGRGRTKPIYIFNVDLVDSEIVDLRSNQIDQKSQRHNSEENHWMPKNKRGKKKQINIKRIERAHNEDSMKDSIHQRV